MQRYLDTIDGIVNRSHVDYHRVFLDEPYDQVLARSSSGGIRKTSRTAR